MNTPGRDALWQAFGLSYAHWLTLPRVLMHEMPDDWQARMAQLIAEFNEAFEWPEELGEPVVSAKVGGRFAPLPEWLGYRYPNRDVIDSLRREPDDYRAGGTD